MTETTITRYRYLGVTDEQTTCDRCVKTHLKSTIILVVLDEDGNDDDVVNFGSTCAAKALGRTGKGEGRKVLDAARFATEKTLITAKEARKALEFYGLPETGTMTVEQHMGAVDKYMDAHRNAMWFHKKTRGDWFDDVRDMLARRQGQIADAARLGGKVG